MGWIEDLVVFGGGGYGLELLASDGVGQYYNAYEAEGGMEIIPCAYLYHDPTNPQQCYQIVICIS